MGWQKQRKLIRTAQAYRQRENFWGDARFDVVAVRYLGPGRYGVEHIPYAFEAP